MSSFGNYGDIEFVEMLINEVKRRPLLWDSTCEHYKYKTKTKAAWMSICELMIPNFSSFSAEDKLLTVHKVNNRWRNIRDNFRRDLKLRAEGGPCKKRKYIFSDRLKFLMKEHTTTTAPSSSQQEDDSAAESSGLDEEDGTTMNENSDVFTFDLHQMPAVTKVEKDEIVEDPLIFVDAFDNNQQSTTNENSMVAVAGSATTTTTTIPSEARDSNVSVRIPSKRQETQCDRQSSSVLPVVVQDENDDDKQFFASLMPMVKTLDSDAKLEFRIEVLNVLRRLKKKSQ